MKEYSVTPFLKKHFALLLILAVAAFLRLHHLGEFSYANDELSALVRTEFNSFGELLDKGIRVDAHPAGVQIFLYAWTSLAGKSEFAVRLPFALAGFLSVWLLFLLGRRWFGKTCGLVAAASLAVLRFPVLYSQVARPYAPGLLFILLAAYFWTILLFPRERERFRRNAAVAGLALSLAACAYTHYFSMLLAGIIAFSGFFFLKRHNASSYVAACLLGALLFVPHLGIFFTQLGYGGVGEWLGAPKPEFLGKYIDYCFNDSAWLKYMYALLCILSAVLYYRHAGRPALYVLCIAWFFLPYGVGYWYSVHFNPVLQYSTLLFSFPFMLLFLAGFLPDEKTQRIRNVLTLVVLLAGLASTVWEAKYYATNHFGVFRQLVERTLEWNNRYGREHLTTVYNITSPAYAGYYFQKFKSPSTVVQYYVADDTSLARLRDRVDSSHTPYFSYGWSNIHHPLEALEYIRARYPVVTAQDTFFNASISLYGRQGLVDVPTFHDTTGYELNRWGEEEKLRSGEKVYAGAWSENLEGREYSLTATRNLAALAPPGHAVAFSAWFCCDTAADAVLVMSFEEGGQSIGYVQAPLNAYNLHPGSWQRILVARHIPEKFSPGCEAKFYIWNPSRKKIFVDGLEISVRPASYYR